MKGYKAFEKGLICDPTGQNPFQYAENTVFETDTAEPYNSGFHFCKNPLDTLYYYPLIDDNGNMTEFAEVEALDDVKTDDNKKYCTKKLKIGAKLTLPQFIKASIDVTYENIKTEVEKETKKVKNSGNDTTLAGGDGVKLAGGDEAKLVGGDKATLAGGDEAKLVGGDNAKLAGGNWAKLMGGENSLMIGDNGSIAKGKKGAVILLVERDTDYNILNFNAVQVDGEIIKEDTFYKLENGKFVEVK